MSKRVLLIGNNNAIDAGLLSLLSMQDVYDVISQPESSVEEIDDGIERFKPDILIIEQDVFTRWYQQCAFLMQSRSNIKMVVVNFENNLVQLFQKNQITLQKPADILSVIA